MKRAFSLLFAGLLGRAVLFLAAGKCQTAGQQQAGEAIDEALQDTERAVEDATD